MVGLASEVMMTMTTNTFYYTFSGGLMDLTVGCKASLLQVKQPLSHHLTHGCDLKGVFPLLCLQR